MPSTRKCFSPVLNRKIFSRRYPVDNTVAKKKLNKNRSEIKKKVQVEVKIKVKLMI